MMTYCHVMWHDDRGSCWTSPNFQTGFGCCSAASGFATTSQPKLPNCQQTAREYLNFMLSNSSKTLERDRVADNWWLQVWLSVGKMLDSAEYEAWCSILAADERTWLTPGKILGGLGEGICIPQTSNPSIGLSWKINGCFPFAFFCYQGYVLSW